MPLCRKQEQRHRAVLRRHVRRRRVDTDGVRLVDLERQRMAGDREQCERQRERHGSGVGRPEFRRTACGPRPHLRTELHGDAGRRATTTAGRHACSVAVTCSCARAVTGTDASSDTASNTNAGAGPNAGSDTGANAGSTARAEPWSETATWPKVAA